MKKIIVFALASLIITAGLVSCKKGEANNSEVQENQAENSTLGNTETPQAIPSTGNSAYEWKHADDEVMLTINGKDFDFATYRYYAMNIKPQYDLGNDDYWNEETEAQFKADMVEELKSVAALEMLCADKGIKLTEEDLAGPDNYLLQFKAIYGEDIYRQQLDMAYLTEDVYKEGSLAKTYINYLYEDAANQEIIREYANKNYVHVKHVLVSTLDENGQELTGTALEEKTALAKEISERAKNGEDFDSLVKEYGEDPGMEATPEGYTFTYGKMVPEFEETSFLLSEGEVSEPVKTSFGYHIIKKYPIDFDALLGEKAEEYWEIISSVASPVVMEELKEKAKSFEVVTTEAFDNLTLMNIGVKK